MTFRDTYSLLNMLRALYRCATITAKTLIILIMQLFLAHKLLTNPTYLFKQKSRIAYVQGLIEITFDWMKIDYLELKKAELDQQLMMAEIQLIDSNI